MISTLRSFLNKKSLLFAGAVATAAVVFISCGGGGGSGTDTSNTTLLFPVATLADPSVPNAQSIASIVLGSSSVIPDPQDISVPPLSVVDSNLTSALFNPIELVMSEFKKIKFDKTNVLNATIVTSETLDCNVSGTETVAYNLTLDEQTFVLSGTVEVTADQCNNDNNTTVDGSMTISMNCRVDSVSGELNNCQSLDMKIGSDGLSSTSVDPVVTTSIIAPNSYFNLADVIMAESLWQTQMTVHYIVTVDGTKYGMEEFLIDYKDIAIDKFSQDFIRGNVYLNNLSNYVAVDTGFAHVPFVYNVTNAVYESGSSQFIGMNDSRIKVYIEDNQHKIAIDSDNDGTYETTVP